MRIKVQIRHKSYSSECTVELTGLPESQRVSAGLTLSFCSFSFTTGNINRPQHQCDQSVSSSAVQQVWLCACVGVGVWAGYRWARLLPVTLHGLNYSSCCGCWSVTCRVPWALMNSPRPECARKKYNEAKRTLETETRTIWERVTLFLFYTFSIAPHHKVMKVSNHEQEKFNHMTNL